jgi:hypothetical protein
MASFPCSGFATIQQVVQADTFVLVIEQKGEAPQSFTLVLDGVKSPHFNSSQIENYSFEAREFARVFVGQKIKYKIDAENR